MLHDFTWYDDGDSNAKLSEVDAFATQGPTTRTPVAKEEELALDKEAFSVDKMDRRRLSRMPIESLFVAEVGTKMVLLVSARDDGVLIRGKAHRIEE